jgi:phosphatidate cytidylyltransferase
MLRQRILTSALLIPIVWAAIWLRQTPIPWFAIFVAIWSLVALYEFYRMVELSGKAQPIIIPGLLLALGFIILPLFPDQCKLTQAWLTLSIVIPLIWVILRRNKALACLSWAWTLAGVLYLGWLTSSYVALLGLSHGREWAFFALFVTFASDSAAYAVGRLTGKHKLAPSISPSKTIEGAIGGVAGAILAGLVIGQLLDLPIGFLATMLLAVAVSLFGQLGDLAESLFKRNNDVKDSSKVLPGHGGFLDRIDSVVFAGLVVYYYVIWLTR